MEGRRNNNDISGGLYMNVPCKDCLLVPKCRNKLYGPLVGDCSLLTDLLYDDGYRSDGFNEIITQIDRALGTSFSEILATPIKRKRNDAT